MHYFDIIMLEFTNTTKSYIIYLITDFVDCDMKFNYAYY